jgi:hypothetical protein
MKWCLYNGTADLLVPRLFDDPLTPWDAYYGRIDGMDPDDLWPEPEGEPEHVVIYSDYGRGWWWEGTAARNTVIGPCDPWDEDAEMHDDRPEWVTFSASTGGPDGE